MRESNEQGDATAGQPPALDRLRVLIIEDQPHMRQLVRHALSRLGIRHVYEAEEGGAGLRMTLRVRPEIVLCDVHMEPVGGLGYLENLRDFQNPEIALTPVIFLTMDAAEETVMRSREHAVNGYLVKPTSTARLRDTINRILGPVIP